MGKRECPARGCSAPWSGSHSTAHSCKSPSTRRKSRPPPRRPAPAPTPSQWQPWAGPWREAAPAPSMASRGIRKPSRRRLTRKGPPRDRQGRWRWRLWRGRRSPQANGTWLPGLRPVSRDHSQLLTSKCSACRSFQQNLGGFGSSM